jgi:hypothetical protein
LSCGLGWRFDGFFLALDDFIAGWPRTLGSVSGACGGELVAVFDRKVLEEASRLCGENRVVRYEAQNEVVEFDL